MSKLYYYNPGYEAEFYTEGKWTPRKNVVQLRRDLAELPFYIAEPGDAVYLGEAHRLPLSEGMTLSPWGWSPELLRLFGPEAMIYSEEEMRYIASRERSRELSAAMVARYPVLYDAHAVPTLLTPKWLEGKEGAWVVKEEYSSSGRGVFFVPDISASEKLVACAHNRRKRFFVEPLYDKMEDRGYEFYRDHSGSVRYIGGSSFVTSGDGRYLRNRVVVPGDMEREWNVVETLPSHSGYVHHLLSCLASFFKGPLDRYEGYFGVDTIVYRDGKTLRLHPCIEINLRPTMGVVALALGERYLRPGVTGLIDLHFSPNKEMMSQLLEGVDRTPLYQKKNVHHDLERGTHLLTTIREATQFVALLTIL